MKTLNLALIGITLSLTIAQVNAGENLIPDFPYRESLRPSLESIGMGTGEAQWTADDAFEGQVVVLQVRAHGHMSDLSAPDKRGYQIQYYAATIDLDSQWGKDGSEYNYIRVTPITLRKVRELEANGRLSMPELGVELANLQVSRDLPLAQERYIEIAPVKVYGTVGWRPKSAPDFELLAHLSLSLGYAMAEPVRDTSNATSNFYTGREFGLTARHKKFGKFDFSYEIDGNQQKYDSASTSSREARVRLDYTYDINQRNSIRMTAEKRSFRFGPDYEKSKRYLLTFERKFK